MLSEEQVKGRIAEIEADIEATVNERDAMVQDYSEKLKALNHERDELAVDMKAIGLLAAMNPEELDALRRRAMAETHDQERAVS